MTVQIKPVETDEERAGVYRLRYEVYVEEMGRYRSIADHQKGHLVEPEDATARLFCGTDDDSNVVATMRVNWGGDAPFNERIVDQYDLQPFLDRIDADQIIVGERFMVARSHRGTDLILRLFHTYMRLVNEKRIQLIFGDCEPHLLNLYLGMGFRTYTRRNVNSTETGYLIPLVMVAEDLDYFRSVGSPLVAVLRDFGGDHKVPECLAEILAAGGAVTSERLSDPGEYASEVFSALSELNENRPSLFDGMSEAQRQICLSKSNLISCRAGDNLIRRGNTAQNMYIALSGTLEARDGLDVIGVITAGDVFGEMAFLLNRSRTTDVYAATDDVTVLSMSESVVRDIMKTDPECAAALLLNISRMLCLKLLNRRP